MIHKDPITMYDFGSEFSQTYEEECPACGAVNRVSTQRDNEPEYMTTIFIHCWNCTHVRVLPTPSELGNTMITEAQADEVCAGIKRMIMERPDSVSVSIFNLTENEPYSSPYRTSLRHYGTICVLHTLGDDREAARVIADKMGAGYRAHFHLPVN